MGKEKNFYAVNGGIHPKSSKLAGALDYLMLVIMSLYSTLRKCVVVCVLLPTLQRSCQTV